MPYMEDDSFTPEDRDLLERTFKLARDNNRMLQSMSRAAMFNGLFRFLAWGLVLGGSAWLYFNYLGPTMETLNQYVGQAQEVTGNANEQFQNVQNIIDSIQKVLPSSATSTIGE